MKKPSIKNDILVRNNGIIIIIIIIIIIKCSQPKGVKPEMRRHK